MVGREVEVDVALRQLEPGRALVVSGVAGVGKTRLLDAIVDHGRAEGWVVQRCAGTESAKVVPLGALASLLPGAPVVGGEADRSAEADTPEAVASVASMIAAIVSPEGVHGERLVVIDDVHHLDDASAAAVAALVHAGSSRLALAFRSGEPVPSAVTAMWKDDRAVRLDLQLLSRDETDALVRSVLGGAVSSAVLHRLWALSEGNALYLRELVRQVARDGILVRSDTAWEWAGQPAIGASLTELIEERLASLDPGERRAAEIVAVDEPIPLSFLRQQVDDDVITRLEAQRTIAIDVERTRRTVRTAHPLFGEALRAGTPRLPADAMRVALADHLELAAARRVHDQLRIVTLRLDAGAPTSQQSLVAAARQAWGMGDTDLVERLAEAAIRLGDSLDAEFLLGQCLSDRGRFEEAVERWRELFDRSPPGMAGRIAVTTASVMALSLDRVDEAVELLDAADRVSDEDGRERVAAARSGLLVLHRPDDHLGELSDALLDAVVGSDEARVWAWIGSARSRLSAGRVDSIVAESDDIFETATRARDDFPLSMMFVGICRFFGLVIAGHLDEAERMSAENLAAAAGDIHPLGRTFWAEGLGILALMRGHLDEAIGHLKVAVDLQREVDHGGLRIALAELAFCWAQQGRADIVAAHLTEITETRHGALEPFVDEARVRAALEAAVGSASVARAILDSALAPASAMGTWYEVPLLHDIARYGGAARVVSRLGELAHAVDGVLVELYRDQARALATNDAAAMTVTAERFMECGLTLDAAETWAAAASAHSRNGRLASAEGARKRMEVLRARCGTVRTPLLNSAAVGHRLTARELEIAGLAADGSSNSDIADHLGLSVRTVHAHLRSIFTKLDVHSREELAVAHLGLG